MARGIGRKAIETESGLELKETINPIRQWTQNTPTKEKPLALFTEIAYSVLCVIIIVPILLMTSGCAASKPISTRGVVVELPGKQPVRRFLIIGFGIVSVKPPDEETAVMALDQTALGVYAGNLTGLRIGIGYQQSTITVVPNGLKADDVRIEVLRKPFEGLEVKTWSGLLNEKDNGSAKDKKDKEVK